MFMNYSVYAGEQMVMVNVTARALKSSNITQASSSCLGS